MKVDNTWPNYLPETAAMPFMPILKECDIVDKIRVIDGLFYMYWEDGFNVYASSNICEN